MRVAGDPEQPFTDGFACAKVNRDAELVHAPQRIKTPLRRTGPKGAGQFAPITWDEALDRVAAAFRKSIEKNDPRNFGMFSCSKTTNELNYAAQKFVRSVMGTNNIDSCNRT